MVGKPHPEAAAGPLLRLLAGNASGTIALLVSSAVPGRAQIEDSFPLTGLNGVTIAIPAGIVGDMPRRLEVSDVRLPLAWTTLCGARPVAMSAAPVPATSLHLLCVSCDALPDLELIASTADAIGRLRGVGPLTTEEINSSQQLNSLINNLPVPLLFVNSITFEVFMNEPARLLLGLPEERLSNRSVSAILARLVADEYPEARNRVLANESRARVSFEIVRQGRTFSVESRWVEDGILLGRVWMFRDITKEHAAARMKDEFVASVSHELRTPLTAIIGSLGLLQAGVTGPLNEKATRLVDVARKNGDRLVKLVNELLDMEKIQSGKVEYSFRPLDLRVLVDEAIQQNAPFAQRFGVSLRAVGPNQPVTVMADADRLTQVLANLLSNAAKFSPAGSEVMVSLEQVGKLARLSVIDQGRGISESFKDKLFRRFSQDADSAVPGHAGSGLGLAIAKSIVEAHGGTIRLDETAQSGTTFRIELTLA